MSLWLIPVLLIYFIVCILLMGIILLQSGKGGGLSTLGSAAGGISDALGATGAEKTLNKITTGIAVGFMVLAIILSIAGSTGTGGDAGEELFGDQPAVPAATAPGAPAPGAQIQQPPAAGQPATTNQLDALPPGLTETAPPAAATEQAPPATEETAPPATDEPAESETPPNP